MGGNLHAVVHAAGCGHKHSLVFDLLSSFDASNRILESALSVLESSSVNEESNKPYRGVDESYSQVESHSPSALDPKPVLILSGEGPETPAPLVGPGSWDSVLDLAGHPSRAGPEWDQPDQVCGGDCQLCLSLRQIQGLQNTTLPLQPLHLVTLRQERAAILRQFDSSSILCIRGPPATQTIS